ncbi:effector-associated constant component EACC1 [Amycolatopsis sp.]|uniref:effector-associated constant component EACC1 n=1 Tax=Amycolatopsis sp. TaxID=37632 RepID=UPI002BDC6C49|nr:hypothetical protein [Amycolatopsis sp.]HVV12080.1 hypothetical protein [Amycolatopsis sp.]
MGLLPELRGGGVTCSVRGRQTGAADWLDILVAGLGSGGALTVLAEILRRFVDRNPDAEIRVEAPDGTKIMTKGASIDDVERTISLVLELGAARERDAAADSGSRPDDGQ